MTGITEQQWQDYLDASEKLSKEDYIKAADKFESNLQDTEHEFSSFLRKTECCTTRQMDMTARSLIGVAKAGK